MKSKYFILPISVVLFAGSYSANLCAETYSQTRGITSNIAHVKVSIGRFFGLFATDKANVEFEFATKNIYGVDGKPKNESQKEKLKRMEEYFKSNVAEMIAFSNINCTYRLDDINKKFRKKMHQNTGVIEVEYNIKCEKNLSGHSVQISLKRLKDIEGIRYQVAATKENSGFLLGNHGIVTIPE